MKRSASILAFTFLAACGPGREAAWERDAKEDLKTQKETETDTEAPDGDLAAQAEAAWEQRADRAKLEEAIAAWEKLAEQSPNDAGILTSLSRAYYVLADGYMRAANETDAMMETFEKGVLAGEQSMMASSEPFAEKVKAGEKVAEAVAAIPPEGQPAIYWYAVNLGKFANEKGFTTVLFYKDRIFAVMQRVLEIDEEYFYGAPHRYFGAFYAKAPAFAGGDMDKSKEHFERALEIGPNYLGTKVLYADFYAAKAEEKELYVRLLEEVVEADPTVLEDVVAEQQIEQAKAERMLAQVDEIF